MNCWVICFRPPKPDSLHSFGGESDANDWHLEPAEQGVTLEMLNCECVCVCHNWLIVV